MSETNPLAHARYCPGQRALGASDSSGAAVQGALLPPDRRFINSGGLEMLSSVHLQPIETFEWVSRGLGFDDGKLSEAVRARWPQPYSTFANDRAFLILHRPIGQHCGAVAAYGPLAPSSCRRQKAAPWTPRTVSDD